MSKGSYLGGHSTEGMTRSQYETWCNQQAKEGASIRKKLNRKMRKSRRDAKRKLKADPDYFLKLFGEGGT